jgi:hypothetical protein
MDFDRRHETRAPLRGRRVEAVLSGPDNAVAAERVLAALGLAVEDDDRPRRISLPFPDGAEELAAVLATLR